MPTYSNLLFCSGLGLNEAGTGLFGSLQNFATNNWVPMTQLEDGGHPPQIPDEMGAFAFSTQGCIIPSVCFFELQPVYVIWVYMASLFNPRSEAVLFLDYSEILVCGVGAEWLCLLKAIPYSAAAQACRWMPRPGVAVSCASLIYTDRFRRSAVLTFSFILYCVL